MWCHLKIFFTSFYLFYCFFVSLYMICVSVQLLSISLDHFSVVFFWIFQFFLSPLLLIPIFVFRFTIIIIMFENGQKGSVFLNFWGYVFCLNIEFDNFFLLVWGFLYFEMYLKMFEERLQMYRKCVSIFVFKSIWQVIRVQWPEGLHGVSHFFGWGFLFFLSFFGGRLCHYEVFWSSKFPSEATITLEILKKYYLIFQNLELIIG